MTLLLLLSALAACEGDLDPRYGKGTSPGTGGSSLPGSGGVTGSGGAPASTGSGGAPAGGGTGGMVAATCTFSQTVLATTCAVSGCHAPAGFPPDFSSDATAAMIVGTAPVTKCAGDSNTSLINAAAPVSGVLFTRLTTACGTGQMPLGGTPLTQTQLDCMKSYFMSKLH